MGACVIRPAHARKSCAKLSGPCKLHRAARLGSLFCPCRPQGSHMQALGYNGGDSLQLLLRLVVLWHVWRGYQRYLQPYIIRCKL